MVKHLSIILVFIALFKLNFAMELGYLKEKCYKQKDSNACLEIGNEYYKLKMYEKAVKYLTKGCDLKNGEACFKLSKLYLHGEGVEGDFDKTFELVKKACRLNYIEGCVEEGVIYKIEGNFDKAFNILKKTCELNSARGCNELGDMYFIGYGVKKDEKKAKEFYRKACKLRYSYGCINLADFYSGKEALKLYKTACNLNNSRACYKVGDFYEKGLYIKKDKKEAKNFYKKACRLNYEKACSKLKNLSKY